MGACSDRGFLFIAHFEGEVVLLEPHCQVSDLSMGCLIVGDQAKHRSVVSKLNDVGVVLGHAVVGEQGVQEGTSTHLCGTPVLRISVADVLLPARQEVQDPVAEGGV